MAERLRSTVTLLTLIGMICGQWVTVLCSVSHGHHSFDLDHDSNRPHWHIGANEHPVGNNTHSPRSHHHTHPHPHEGANDGHAEHQKGDHENAPLIASFSPQTGDDHSIVYFPEFAATPALRDSVLLCNDVQATFDNAFYFASVEPLNLRAECVVVVSRSVPVQRYLQLLSIRL